MADKGFDGLFVEQGAQGSLYITVCEDKATENPRSTFTSDVLAAIRELERGDRDSELLNEITSLLQTIPELDVEELIASLNFQQARRYRVAMTVENGDDADLGRMALFSGYSSAAPGSVGRRCAETVRVEPLRAWMESFCGEVVRILNSMRPARDV